MLTEDLLKPKTIMVNDQMMTYYDSEDEKGDSDHILVLIHGTTGSTASHFGFLFPILAARQRVISIDWKEPNGVDTIELSDLSNQIADTLKILTPNKKITLLGYSLGAVVCTQIAAQYPSLIQRLVLIAGWVRTDFQQILRNDIWKKLRLLEDDQALREYTIFCAFGGPFLATKTYDDILPSIQAMQFNHFFDMQMDLNRRIDITTEAEAVNAPTLIIACTHDQMVPIRHQKQLFGAIKNSRYVEIPSGHAVVFERPSEVCHHVQQFIDYPNKYAHGTVIPTPKP